MSVKQSVPKSCFVFHAAFHSNEIRDDCTDARTIKRRNPWIETRKKMTNIPMIVNANDVPYTAK